MLTKNRYSIKDMILWTRGETFIFFLIALIPTILFHLAGQKWIQLPWLPIALVGTAVAFLIGFRNNITYGRIWEARKIWGGIVNSSRSWTMMVRDMLSNDHTDQPVSDEELKGLKTTIVHRHIAWFTALRHAMRQSRPWEGFLQSKTNREWSKMMHIPEFENKLEDDLKPLLSEKERIYVLGKTNKPTTILSLQSKHIKELKGRGLIWEFSFLNLEELLKDLYDLQGKTERIKNFPYPRQYATLNSLFVWTFILLLPFGVIPEFARIGESLIEAFPIIGDYFVWLSIPFIVIVSWIFHTMERIGRVGENPYEGSANDVPISTISRGIEIDLREMLDEDKETIPEPLQSVYNVQM
jgi:putative membrane protein